MSCEILSGYNSFEMCDSQAGVAEWYAFSRKNLATFTKSGGEVTAITLTAGKYAYPFLVEQETSSLTSTSVGEKVNKAYAVEEAGTIILHGNSADMIENIELLAKDRTVWIAKLNDGSYEIAYTTYGAKVNFERTTGTAMEDMNGYTLTLSGKEPYMPLKIDSNLVQALLAPAS